MELINCELKEQLEKEKRVKFMEPEDITEKKNKVGSIGAKISASVTEMLFNKTWHVYTFKNSKFELLKRVAVVKLKKGELRGVVDNVV